MLQRRTVFLLGMLVTAAGFTGCCFDCFSPINEKYINLAFPTDSLSSTGFQRTELRSVYLVRYNQAGFQGLPDTLRQLPSGLPATGDSALYYLSLYPEPATGTLLLPVYAQPGIPLSFRVVMPATGRVYELDKITRTYEDPTSGCHCRYVREKQFVLDGQPRVQKISGPEAATRLSR